MESLPSELLLKIIQFVNIKSVEELDDIRRVNRIFSIICNHHSILKNVISGINKKCKCDGRKVIGSHQSYFDKMMWECSSCQLYYHTYDLYFECKRCCDSFCYECTNNDTICDECRNYDEELKI